MTRYYCPVCEKETRYYGWGTDFAAVLTGGLAYLLVPFYRKKCITCGCYPLIKLPPLPPTGVCPACSMAISEEEGRCPYCAYDIP